MNWKVGEAKQRFSEVLRAAASEPQPVFKRDRLVAVVVDAEMFREFEQWREKVAAASLWEATEELRRLTAEEGPFEVPDRRDRKNAFLDAADDEAPL